MANLENNNDSENKKSVTEKISDSVNKGAENVENTVKQATELASDAINHPIETAQELGKQVAKDITTYSWWAKLLLILFYSALGLFTLIFIVLNLNITKQWAADEALKFLNKDFKASIKTEKVEVNFFGDVTITGLTIKDYKGLEFIKARQVKANSDWIRLIKGAVSGNSNSLNFNSIKVDTADIKVITYKGDSISNFIRYIDLWDSGKPRDPKKPPFTMDARVLILNTKASIINQNSPGEAGKWLNAVNVNLIAPKVKVIGPEVTANINNFTFTSERHGKKHFVDTFSTELSVNKKLLSLKDLTFNTSHSLLQGDIIFNLHPETGWQDFSNKVSWDMNVKSGSQLSGYDISYFVTQWDNYKPFNLSGKMNGPLNNFTLNNFLLGNRDVDIQTNTMSFKNLLKGNFDIETQRLSAEFTYIDLKAMMPTFISDKMKNFADDFGRLKYNGTASVTPEKVYIQKGDLITGIGQAQIQNFSLTEFSTDTPKYEGRAQLQNFNTSVITKSNAVGLLSGDFILKGQSFDVNKMIIETNSNIHRIEIMGQSYQNATLIGTLNHRKYNGLVNVNDPNLQGSVNGLIDFSTPKLYADIKADFKRLNLGYLTGTGQNQIVTGAVDGKIAMTNLNDLMVDATLNNVNIYANNEKIEIPNGHIKSHLESGKRYIDIHAPGAAIGTLNGDFNLGDLAGMIENGLNKILVGPEPPKKYLGQNFDMNFDVSQGLISYFLPDLKIPYGAHIDGSFDGNTNNLILNADIEKIIYLMQKEEDIDDAKKALSILNADVDLSDIKPKQDSAIVDQLLVRINTANREQQIFTFIRRAQLGQNILKSAKITGQNINNEKLHVIADFQLGTPEREAEDKMKTYAINFNQYTNEYGDYVVKFDPTSLNINHVTWEIDADPNLNHSITYKKQSGVILAENIRFFSENSELFVKNARFKSGKDFEGDLEIKNLDIGKLFGMTANGNTMDFRGVANGTINIKKSDQYLEPIIDVKINEIKMGNKDIGDLIVTAKNSSQVNVYDIEAKIISGDFLGNNKLHVLGTVDNNTPSPTIDIKADMKDFDIAFSQQFVTGIFSNMRGKANGILSISGPMNEIDYSGDIALSNFGLKLDFTGVDYSFEDTVIPLSKGFAGLNNVKVKDGRSNSKGSISGFILFETISSMAVNLIMTADNLLILNSTQQDNDLFWGRVYGQGDLYVSGPVSGLEIATPNMRALNNSVFTFNSSSTSNVDEFKMLRFLKEDKLGSIIVEEKKKSGAGMNIDFSVAVDKGTSVNVLVGEDVGDISVRGDSDEIRFRMSRSGVVSLDGDYYVDNGTFVSKAILERTFQIARGSSIKWDSDPMTPALDIRANYVRTVSNTGEYLGMSALPPINVLLGVGITGTLSNPLIALSVDAPDVSTQLKETLATKMSNEDEKVIQFGSILVMNSFNVSNSGGFDINVSNQLESTGYNMLFKQLGSVLNTISNEFQVDLNYLKGDQGSNTGDRANASVSIAVSPRVTIKTGLGVPITKTENTTNQYLSGEGTIEYDWSKKNDGTRLFRIYSKPSNIGLVAGGGNAYANQTYGVGAVYSKSFSRLFKRKNKNNKQDSVKNSNDSIQKVLQK